MSKHTPGPWKSTGKEVGVDYTATHGAVASIIGMPNRWETAANAALIAAAPDLLDACQAIVELRDLAIGGVIDSKSLIQAMDYCRGAIIKAGGR